MGATIERAEARRLKKEEYEPLVNELNLLYHEGFARDHLTFEKPIETWLPKDHIIELIRRAKICKQQNQFRRFLLDEWDDLHRHQFVVPSNSPHERWKFLQDPELYMASLSSAIREANELKEKWPSRRAAINSLPFDIPTSDFPSLKRLSDADFQMEIERRTTTYRREVQLQMAKRLVDQGFLPALNLYSPHYGYENVSDLEQMVQKRMAVRERFMERIAAAEPEPEEGSALVGVLRSKSENV